MNTMMMMILQRIPTTLSSSPLTFFEGTKPYSYESRTKDWKKAPIRHLHHLSGATATECGISCFKNTTRTIFDPRMKSPLYGTVLENVKHKLSSLLVLHDHSQSAKVFLLSVESSQLWNFTRCQNGIIFFCTNHVFNDRQIQLDPPHAPSHGANVPNEAAEQHEERSAACLCSTD